MTDFHQSLVLFVSIRDIAPVQLVLKATTRVRSHLCAHIVLWCRVVVFSQLNIPQIRDPQKEFHEVFVSGSVDEKLPQRKALREQSG